MKKTLIATIAVVSLIGLAGCSLETPAMPVVDSFESDQAKVEENQKKVQNSVQIPQLTTSAERKNISERATFFDNENLTTYIYLLSKQGSVVGFYPVRGKVSSLNSFLSPTEKLVNADGGNCTRNLSSEYDRGIQWEPCYPVSAPDIDGAYGDNADGIFFFTADTGAYIEWNGEYMVSSQPLKLSTQPLLIREVK
jgi:hypothetical protein